MPLYRYKAVSAGGDVASGELDAANEAEIADRLRDQGLMPMTDGMRTLIMKHATATELKAEAVRGGMLTMYEDGLRKAVAGVTTVEEVLRATRED